jgi:integrase/recombinase XerD
VGLRDRALIALLVYTFARVSAALHMNVEDYYPQGKRWWVRLHEKGGKQHEMPAHHLLALAAGIAIKLGCHTFRATGITVYLLNGGLLEYAQQMAAHESACTTKLYVRRNDRPLLDRLAWSGEIEGYAVVDRKERKGLTSNLFPTTATLRY